MLEKIEATYDGPEKISTEKRGEVRIVFMQVEIAGTNQKPVLKKNELLSKPEDCKKLPQSLDHYLFW